VSNDYDTVVLVDNVELTAEGPDGIIFPPSVSPTQTPIPTSTGSVTPTIPPATGSTTINFALDIPGIGGTGNKSPRYSARELKLTLYNSQNQIAKEVTQTFNFDGTNFKGTVNLGAIQTGYYYIKVKIKNSLIKLLPGLHHLESGKLNALSNISQIKIYPVDLNDDNKLDLLDYNIFVKRVYSCGISGKPFCSAVEPADFNDDSRVDLSDYNIFLEAINSREGE